MPRMPLAPGTPRCCVIALCALVLAPLTAPILSAQAADPPRRPRTARARKAQRTALKGKLSTVKSEISDMRGKLREAKRDEETITREVASAKGKLTATRARINAAKYRLTRTRREQEKVTALLVASAKRLKTREITLGRRMAANYRQGPVRYASVILGSRSMREMVSRAYVVRTIVRYDALLIAEIKSDRQAVMNWKKQADQKSAQVAGLLRELAAQQNEEARDTVQLRVVLAEARAARAELEDEIATLEADSKTIAARIRALLETPLGRVRKLIVFSGGFIRPVPGNVTSGFGMRYHPILHITKLHTGVDFSAGSGTPIVAAAEGIVIFAGSLRGYGNTVVVDHGGGISTLYAHQSQILASEGQTVSKGTVIGRVGSTGYSTGPHLHFEVRRGGAPVNPLGAL